MNNTTRRYPRTLNEAFGPHVDNTIWEHYEPVPSGYGKLWWTCIALISIATAFLLYVGV
jgi:hypothetical protein